MCVCSSESRRQSIVIVSTGLRYRQRASASSRTRATIESTRRNKTPKTTGRQGERDHAPVALRGSPPRYRYHRAAHRSNHTRRGRALTISRPTPSLGRIEAMVEITRRRVPDAERAYRRRQHCAPRTFAAHIRARRAPPQTAGLADEARAAPRVLFCRAKALSPA